MSTLWRQVKPLFCTWEIESPGDSVLLSLCLALGHWARSSGSQGVVGEEFEVRFFWLMPFQLHHKQGLAPVIEGFVVGASAHTACWVSGSLVFPPCGVLSLLPALSDFGNFILLCPWVPVASWLLAAHLGTPHFLFGLFPALSYLLGFSVRAPLCTPKPLSAKHSPTSSWFPSTCRTLQLEACRSVVSYSSAKEL